MIFDELISGKSVQNNPISVFKSDAKGKKFIYLVAGIRGDEVEGQYVLKQLLLWLSQNHDMPDYPVIIIPSLNIDGYRNVTKENAHGIDLLQDFPCSEFNTEKKKEFEPESTFLVKLFKKYTPKIFINFSSGKPPLINHSDNSKNLASFISKLNFYDMKKISSEKKSHCLALHLDEKYKALYLNIRCPRISEDVCLQDLWTHNDKALKELFYSELIAKTLNS
ncbi:MAG: hypothetical protein H6621_11575 [Halobacteriovoraceae bacterium]|nr:hypothetical protein [Halobacteriovoraceae bacterium]MCB9095699.1 hypothetical protein [Halobacteriovoraceae bacterium]